jgi:hypothetical protein
MHALGRRTTPEGAFVNPDGTTPRQRSTTT